MLPLLKAVIEHFTLGQDIRFLLPDPVGDDFAEWLLRETATGCTRVGTTCRVASILTGISGRRLVIGLINALKPKATPRK